MVTSGRTQVCVSTLTLPTDVTAAAELEGLEGVKVCPSEFSMLLLLSAILGLSEVEASEVESRRVEVSSLGGVEFSLVEALNHELPQGNKPAAFRKQRKIKQQQG